MTNQKIIKRLNYLVSMITKYAHRYDVSMRVHNWVDEYNDLKDQHWNGAWKEYCKLKGFDFHHDGHDCRA
jgi:hypothetical protein